MSEFNDHVNRGAQRTIDISYQDLQGANLGQRPDLLSQDLTCFRTPDSRLWSLYNGVLAPASNLVPYILSQSGVPIILPSSGTVGANGGLTGLTALPYTVFPVQAVMWFPAGALYAGSVAGGYYASVTSATTATIYNDRYLSDAPVFPATPTPIVAAGPGAYTQFVGEVVMFSTVIPANAIGVSGSLRVWRDTRFTNVANANTKNTYLRLNNSSFDTQTNISQVGSKMLSVLTNRGVASKQVGGTNGYGHYLGTTPVASTVYMAQNTALPSVLTISSGLTVATDYIIVEAYSVEILPG